MADTTGIERRTLIDTQGRTWKHGDAPAPQDAVRMRRIGKQTAGSLLDGRHHNATPVSTT